MKQIQISIKVFKEDTRELMIGVEGEVNGKAFSRIGSYKVTDPKKVKSLTLAWNYATGVVSEFINEKND